MCYILLSNKYFSMKLEFFMISLAWYTLYYAVQIVLNSKLQWRILLTWIIKVALDILQPILIHWYKIVGHKLIHHGQEGDWYTQMVVVTMAYAYLTR